MSDDIDQTDNHPSSCTCATCNAVRRERIEREQRVECPLCFGHRQYYKIHPVDTSEDRDRYYRHITKCWMCSGSGKVSEETIRNRSDFRRREVELQQQKDAESTRQASDELTEEADRSIRRRADRLLLSLRERAKAKAESDANAVAQEREDHKFQTDAPRMRAKEDTETAQRAKAQTEAMSSNWDKLQSQERQRRMRLRQSSASRSTTEREPLWRREVSETLRKSKPLGNKNRAGLFRIWLYLMAIAFVCCLAILLFTDSGQDVWNWSDEHLTEAWNWVQDGLDGEVPASVGGDVGPESDVPGIVPHPSLTPTPTATPSPVIPTPTSIPSPTLIPTLEPLPTLATLPRAPAGAGSQDRFPGGSALDAQAIESAILRHTNEARDDAGLSPLKHDPAIDVIARGHSENMIVHGFYHDLLGQDPTDRALAAGYDCRAHNADGSYSYGLSENIYEYPRVQLWMTSYFGFTSQRRPETYIRSEDEAGRLLVQGWLESPGHRKNILDRDARRIGVGVAVQPVLGEYGWNEETIFATQNFSECH